MKPTVRSDRPDCSAMVIEAARCWRTACDQGEPPMPCLYSVLERHHCGLLTPVFDGLLRTCETCLHRRFQIGADESLSADERGLLTLLGNPPSVVSDISPAAAPMPITESLACAVSSARIMLELEGQDFSADTLPRNAPAAPCARDAT